MSCVTLLGKPKPLRSRSAGRGGRPESVRWPAWQHLQQYLSFVTSGSRRAQSNLTPLQTLSYVRLAAVKTATSYEKVELLYTGPGAEAMRRNLQGLLK